MSNGNSSARSHHGLDLTDASPIEHLASTVGKQLDPFGVTTSIMNAQMSWLTHPQELSRAMTALSSDILALQMHVARRAMGMPSDDVVTPHEDDTRFADSVWKNSATWDIVKETYLAFTHRLEDMCYETPGLSDKERRRAAFWFRKWLNAVAPTNFFWTNPVAMKKFVQTKGESARQGFKYLMRDAQSKNVRMVEENAFTVGVDLATTPGTVVFRNRML